MANISKINFNGEALDIKDTRAREQIQHLTADNYTADVTGNYTVNAGDIAMSSANATMHTTADRTIDTGGNDSVHIDGTSTLNVGGLRTETFAGNKTETVTGTATEKFNNINTTVTGKWLVNTPTKSFDVSDIATGFEVYKAIDDRDALNLITFGDSYDNLTENNTSWSNKLASLLNARVHYKYGVSGMGFVSGTWLEELNKAISELTQGQRDACNMLLVGGGANDLTTTADGTPIFNAIKTFVKRAREGFKNAKIYIAFIADGFNGYVTTRDNWSNRMTPWSIYLTENFYRFACGYTGAIYLNATRWSKKDFFNPGDYIHPNSAGQNSIGETIFKTIYNITANLDSEILLNVNGTERKIGAINHHEHGRNIHLEAVTFPCNFTNFTGYVTDTYSLGKMIMPISQVYNIAVSGAVVINVDTSTGRRAFLVPANIFTTDDGNLYITVGAFDNGYISGTLTDITMKLTGNSF